MENLGRHASVAATHKPWGLHFHLHFISEMLVHCMVQHKLMALTFNRTKDLRKNRDCKNCFQ